MRDQHDVENVEDLILYIDEVQRMFEQQEEKPLTRLTDRSDENMNNEIQLNMKKEKSVHSHR